MTAPAALECRDLSAGYDKLVVVRKLDLAVRHKEILAVLGPNGAGKTTLLMTLAGFLAPAGGTIMMDGTEVRCGSPRRANRAGIVLVPDYRALFTELTPVQNLQLAAKRGGPSVTEVLDLFPALRRRVRIRVGDLSGGEQQMLALGRALIQAPRVLLIDEMSMGLAPVVVESLIPLVRQVADESGAAVVLVEQHVRLALEVADQAAMLVHGDLVTVGPAVELGRDAAALEAAYLGGGEPSPRQPSLLDKHREPHIDEMSTGLKPVVVESTMMPTLTAEPVAYWGVPRAEFAADADRVELELVPELQAARNNAAAARSRAQGPGRD